MGSKTIGIIAAMPDEIAPLLKKVGHVHRELYRDLNLYRFSYGRNDVCLLESRIGMEQSARATRALLDFADIGMILNIGLGGAPLPDLSAGDIVVAERLLYFKERLFSEQQGLDARFTADCISALRSEKKLRVCLGTSITAAEILDKKSLASLIPSGVQYPVLEMETTAVARIAREHSIPLAAIRAISDGADEELGFSIGEFTDNEMRISPWRVLGTIARKPRIVPQLIRLGMNSRRAAENLAVSVLAIIDGLQHHS
jgi:adenosylhomocysteine nucleosidase